MKSITKDKLLKEAEVYFLKREYEKALEYLNRVLELDNNFAYGYSCRGTTYYELGKYEEALEDYNKAIELYDKDKAYYSNRGYVYYKLERYEEALEDYNKFFELDEEYVEKYILDKNDEYQLQEKLEEHTYELEEYYIKRGDIYYKLEKYKEALKDFSKVTNKSFYDDEYYNKMANIYYELERYEEVLEKYNCIKNFSVNLYNGRGNTYYKLKRYEDAIQDYIKSGENVNSYYLAYCYLSVGYYEYAIQNFDKFLENNQDNKEARYYRGLAYYFRKDYNKALEDFKFCIDNNFEKQKAYNNKAICDLALKNKGNFDIEFSDTKFDYEENQINLLENKFYCYLDEIILEENFKSKKINMVGIENIYENLLKIFDSIEEIPRLEFKKKILQEKLLKNEKNFEDGKISRDIKEISDKNINNKIINIENKIKKEHKVKNSDKNNKSKSIVGQIDMFSLIENIYNLV